MQPDRYQAAALKTWYAPDHELYLDPRHALLGLAGEAGELIELYKKNQYKPGFSWWRCKKCRFTPEDKKQSEVDHFAYTCFNGERHASLVLDELGDYSYYLRILMFQAGLSFEFATLGYEPSDFSRSLEHYLNDLALHSVKQHAYWLRTGKVSKGRYQRTVFAFMAILASLNCTLDHLTELNYRKLNSEPTAHGWKR